MKPKFFKTPANFRAWMEKNHATAPELLVGFYKMESGRSSITWPQSVDVALCFGWIDGVRRRQDETAYTIRFTPRKPSSIWSAINARRILELERLGLMTDAGRAAFARRDAEKTKLYSYESRHSAAFDAKLEHQFRADKGAWEFFQSQPPGYRKVLTFWVMQAKQEETRRRRLGKLIASSANRKRFGDIFVNK